MLISKCSHGSSCAQAPSSRLTITGLVTMICLRRAGNSSRPIALIASRTGWLLPSKMGASGALISTTALSNPTPANAAIICSIVSRPMPSPFTIRVHRRACSAYLACASTVCNLASISIRRNLMPVFAGAGQIDNSTNRPE